MQCHFILMVTFNGSVFFLSFFLNKKKEKSRKQLSLLINNNLSPSDVKYATLIAPNEKKKIVKTDFYVASTVIAFAIALQY